MASEQNSVGMNGNYAATQVQGYGGLEQSYNAHSNTSSSTTDQNNTTGSTGTTTNGSGGNPDIPKDEVGWYFVEQYYTTLSRSPEKLFVSCMRIPKDHDLETVRGSHWKMHTNCASSFFTTNDLSMFQEQKRRR